MRTELGLWFRKRKTLLYGPRQPSKKQQTNKQQATDKEQKITDNRKQATNNEEQLLDEGHEKLANPKKAHREFIGNPFQGSTYTLPQKGVLKRAGDSPWRGFFSLTWVLLDPVKLWYSSAGVQLPDTERGSNSPKGPEVTRKQPTEKPLPPGHAAISRPIF